MSEKKALGPANVADEKVIAQCKEALNKWSSSLAFAVTKQLGTDAEFVSAQVYHAYGFLLSTNCAQREFVLEKGGTPKPSPVDIKTYDLWDVKGMTFDGEYKKEIPDTCFKRECEECHSDGKVTCDRCDGSGKEQCGKCDGSGEVKCSECGGVGEKWCSACRGGGKIGIFEPSGLNDKKPHCHRCGGTGKETCKKCHGSQVETCKKCHGSGEVTCDKCGGKGEIKCDECGGRGWNAFVYYLVQKQKSEEIKKVWGDVGLREVLDYDKYSKCFSLPLFSQSSKDGEHVSESILDGYEAPFCADLKTVWQEGEKPYIDVKDCRIIKQTAELKQIDALVKYVYMYKGNKYDVWIDLSTENVFESGNGGLMIDFWFTANKEKFLPEQLADIQGKMREVPTDKLFKLKIRNPKTVFGFAVSPLGWIGVHRFILGQVWLGVFELLAFFLGPIRLMWWLIELFQVKKAAMKSNYKKVMNCR